MLGQAGEIEVHGIASIDVAVVRLTPPIDAPLRVNVNITEIEFEVGLPARSYDHVAGELGTQFFFLDRNHMMPFTAKSHFE